jgi:hypothetical protein
VIDSYKKWGFAALAGIPTKALIYKALTMVTTGYQQSYPQKPWTSSNLHTDQIFRTDFTSSLQDSAATGVRR